MDRDPPRGLALGTLVAATAAAGFIFGLRGWVAAATRWLSESSSFPFHSSGAFDAQALAAQFRVAADSLALAAEVDIV
jgi:hypothetical protein